MQVMEAMVLAPAFSLRKAWLALRTVISMLSPGTQASTEFGRRWLQLTAHLAIAGRAFLGWSTTTRTLTCEHLRMKLGNEPRVVQDHIELAKGVGPYPGGLRQAGSRVTFGGRHQRLLPTAATDREAKYSASDAFSGNRRSPSVGTIPNGILDQLREVRRRITRHSLPDVVVTAEFYGTEERVKTDPDGYFRIHMRPGSTPPVDALWHTVEISVETPQAVRAQAEVFIPSERCRYVVISDIDDTIMKTGVANKLMMLWRLFVADAESREAFPGVGALYRALYTGRSGNESNPMLYVSRAPWGIYEVIEEFFRRQNIPVGPILFLREWGISWTSPLPRKAEDHKRDLIRNMLDLYHDLPFVLIGDSGQHDPEIYHKIVAEHPNRVLAVYIRNVSRRPERIQEIEKLAAAGRKGRQQHGSRSGQFGDGRARGRSWFDNAHSAQGYCG